MTERGKESISGKGLQTQFGAFQNLIVEGMVEGGLSVVDLGLIPTPLFYYSLFTSMWKVAS